ncbi:5150_t:CDS:10 [Acaulospora morrowiae]|uniref:5150_t:CDS:1 n=1 Tax=Acaulospora morrowiae TaxID=94023 RepID=A0A9N8V175_9GLOM|nr:5150_t:CDS:10 [Acaulospora morrowiae]
MLDTICRIEQTFLLSFRSREICLLANIGVQRSILLSGPSGTGKTHVIRSLCSKYQAKLFDLTIGDLAAEFPAETEKGLWHYFLLARKNQPSVCKYFLKLYIPKLFLIGGLTAPHFKVLLENIELFFPIDEKPLLPFYFCELIENYITQDVAVLVVGITTNANLVNPIVRTIFQDEIEIEIPTPKERLEIFGTYTKVLDLDNDINVHEINEMCHGFVAADIVCLCRMASEMADIRSIQETGVPGQSRILNRDFLDSFKKIRISSLQGKNSAQKVDSVKWDHVGGLNEAKKILEESVIWMYKHFDAFRRLGIRPSKGVLLYGPPGTGKTLLAKAVTTESSVHFIPVSIPDLVKSEVGESEKIIASMFKIARRCSPCIIFLDELDALFGNRESSSSFGRKLVSQLLLELDELDLVDQGVVILAATNNPEAIDPSLLRSGRLDRLVYVQPPNFEERKSIFTILSNAKTRFSNNVDIDELAEKTVNFTGADIQGLVQRAALLAFKKFRKSDNKEEKTIDRVDLLEALSNFKPSINDIQLTRYQKFTESMGIDLNFR